MSFGAFASVALLAVVVPHVQAAHPSQAGAPAATAARATQTFERLIFRGVTSPGKAAAQSAATGALILGTNDKLVRQSKRGHTAADVHPGANRRAAIAAAAVVFPTPPGEPIVSPDRGFFGFPGLTHADQRLASNGNQFSLEPPDQALCVGNGFVMEGVNNALAIYSAAGTLLSGPTAFSQFFGLPPEIVRPSGPFGPFISDPRCQFDRQTQRWFVTELEIDVDPVTRAMGPHSSVMVAVSQTADPTGAYSVLSFDTSDMRNPGCPCFGDQPLIGADANGFYVSTNEFPITGPGFNGAQVYAMSKLALAAGVLPTVVHFNTGTLPTPDVGGIWYSIQPASSPTSNATGTEFFLSALDFNNAGVVGGTSDNRVAAWALTNTQSLKFALPSVALQNVVIKGVTYTQPPPATQKPGRTPLGTSLGAPLELLQTNDDRMNQVVYAAGQLWAGVNTAVRFGETIDSGIAYFVVAPDISKNVLTARMVGGGYVAARGQNVFFPSIGVNAAGKAVLACSLSGPNFFPSAVYVPLNSGNTNIRLAGMGLLPDDGFTAYAAFMGNGAGRWGDYSAAVADADGSIWFGAEYIPDSQRTVNANWGTFIGHVHN